MGYYINKGNFMKPVRIICFLLALTIAISACGGKKTALMMAVLEGDTASVKTLLNEGADVNEKDVYGKTALMKASEKGDIATVKTLLDRGADVNVKTDQGGTALLAASYGGHSVVMQTLLNKGGKVNAKDIFGTTALMAAARYGHMETVQVLLKAGADAKIKNKKGITALMLASNENHAEIVKLLKKSLNQDTIVYDPVKRETKDISPPVIEIIHPRSITRGLGGVTSGTIKDFRTTIEGIAQDDSKIAWVTINDKQANLGTGGKFRLEVNLGVGENRFLIAAMDTEKNIGRKEIVINRETGDIATSSQNILTFSGNYYALIIGNNNYKDLPKLKTAQYDAQEVKRILEKEYGFSSTLLLDATRNNIMRSLNDHRKKLTENDNFLIYYAGHGEFDEMAQKAYWLPVDALRDDDTNWIIVDNITANIKRISSKHVLIVADSCYSGTFTRKAVTNLGSAQAKRRYLQKMFKKSSRTLMASGGNEPVSDVGGGRHSVFANAFIKGLMNEEQEIFTAEEFYYEHIKERVAGNAQQTPEYNPVRKSGHDGGDFIFKRSNP
jgi:hypothetical protein